MLTRVAVHGCLWFKHKSSSLQEMENYWDTCNGYMLGLVFISLNHHLNMQKKKKGNEHER